MDSLILLILGFLLTLLLTKPCLALLYKLKIGQKILDDTPESHQKKSGTPTMGGLLFVLGIIFLGLLDIFINKSFSAVPLYAFPLLMGLLGAADDYLTVHPKNGVRGIKSQPKALFQGIITIGFVCWLAFVCGKTFNIFGLHLNGIWYVIVVSFIITGYINFTNITDGLDGLLAGIVLCICIIFTFGFGENMLAFLGGMCLAFLVTNSNPAKLFMGDTGSLCLGAFLMAFAFWADMEWLMFIASCWIILEGFSVIIQWTYFKITKKIYGEGKRVFLMAPIHHHFELGGWKETKVVANFTAVSFVLCAFGYGLWLLK